MELVKGKKDATAGVHTGQRQARTKDCEVADGLLKRIVHVPF